MPSFEKPCMVRPTLFDINPVELENYLFLISIAKCTGSCNVVSPKLCVPRETKYLYLKALNMITNVIVNASSVLQHVIQNKNEIIKHVSENVKIIIRAENIMAGIQGHVFVRKVRI